MIELKKINAGYDARRLVLHDVSARIDAGKITVVMGPNGAGKSTLLKTMYGLLRYTGEVYLNGKKIRPTPQFYVTQGIFMIPQGKRVFRNMTVADNLDLAAHFWSDKTLFPARLEEALTHFPDLKPRLSHLAGNLSGGQQQMLAIARVLINRPKLVLMDEPSTGLSPKLIKDLFAKIKDIKDKTGTGFVIVEHNLQTLLPLVDHAYILDQGRVVYDGPAASKTIDKMMQSIFKE